MVFYPFYFLAVLKTAMNRLTGTRQALAGIIDVQNVAFDSNFSKCLFFRVLQRCKKWFTYYAPNWIRNCL